MRRPIGASNMALQKRKVVSSLTKKGFEKDDEGHHVYLRYRFLNGGESKIRTRVSHGSRPKDLNDYRISEMSRQVGLTKKEFLELVSCPMSQDDYEEIIRNRRN